MVGEFGRVSVVGRALSDDDIGSLAAGGREHELSDDEKALAKALGTRVAEIAAKLA